MSTKKKATLDDQLTVTMPTSSASAASVQASVTAAAMSTAAWRFVPTGRGTRPSAGGTTMRNAYGPSAALAGVSSSTTTAAKQTNSFVTACHWSADRDRAREEGGA